MYAPSTQTIIDNALSTLKIEADDTSNALYSLYSKGYISYPRTVSNYLQKEQINEAPVILFSIFQSNYNDEFITKQLLEIEPSEFKEGVLEHDNMAFDHRAITPTGKLVNTNELTTIEEKINKFVVLQYLCLFNVR
jgi:DNA topoisomerase-3